MLLVQNPLTNPPHPKRTPTVIPSQHTSHATPSNLHTHLINTRRPTPPHLNHHYPALTHTYKMANLKTNV